MRLNEILIEQQVDEAPKGFLSRQLSKAKSFVPGQTGRKAKGDLEVGKEANWLIKQFDTFIGKINKKPSPQVVIDFLRKNNYPTGDAEQEMTKVTKGQKVGGAVGAVAKGTAKAVGAVGKGIADVAKGAVGGVQNSLKKVNQVNPNDAADPKAKQPADANAQQPNTQAAATTDPKATTQPAVDPKAKQPADPKATTQPAANPDANLQIKGAKKKIPAPSEKQVVNQSIDWSEAEFIFEDGAVTLSRGQLDNVFMAAVRQAVARDEGGQADTGSGVAPANAQQGGIGGFAQGAADKFKKPGSSLPPELQAKIEMLPARDKQQLLKML